MLNGKIKFPQGLTTAEGFSKCTVFYIRNALNFTYFKELNLELLHSNESFELPEFLQQQSPTSKGITPTNL